LYFRLLSRSPSHSICHIISEGMFGPRRKGPVPCFRPLTTNSTPFLFFPFPLVGAASCFPCWVFPPVVSFPSKLVTTPIALRCSSHAGCVCFFAFRRSFHLMVTSPFFFCYAGTYLTFLIGQCSLAPRRQPLRKCHQGGRIGGRIDRWVL